MGVPMKRWFLFVICTGLLLQIGSAEVFGQPGGPAPPAAESPDKQAPESLLELILAGGMLNVAFMAVLGLFSLVAVAIIIERFVNLTAGKVMPPGLLAELKTLVERRVDNPQPFRDLCQRFPSPLAVILKAGLIRAGRPLPEVEKAMEDAAAREAMVLRARIRPLSVLAGVAPMVGLLGTVVGMIMAFRTASQAGLGKAELLAEGIYLALETTVAGLIIAIPAQLFASWFYHQMEKFLRQSAEHLIETMPCFMRMEQAGVEEAPAGRPAPTKDKELVGAGN